MRTHPAVSSQAPSQFFVAKIVADLWCTAEMSIAIIVVSLPALKVLIMRSVPSTANCSTDGHFQSESRKHMEAYIPRSLGGSFEKYHSRIQGGHPSDDDIELADQSFGNSTRMPIRMMSTECRRGESIGMTITKNATVARSML